MNKSKLLSDLYNGKIRPIEREIKKGTVFYNLSMEVDSLGDEVKKLLDEDGKKLFHAYLEGNGKLLYLNSEERFIGGFKLGARLTAEILYEKDDEIKV